MIINKIAITIDLPSKVRLEHLFNSFVEKNLINYFDYEIDALKDVLNKVNMAELQYKTPED